MQWFLRTLPLVLFWVTPVSCCAALRWENPEVTLTAPVGAKEVMAEFRFKNVGLGPVTITDIQPECGCTRVELAKRIYAPGETGALKATMTLEKLEGTQRKHIALIADDAAGVPVQLTLGVEIPALFTLASQTLVWRTMGEPTEKFATIIAATSLGITSIEVTSVTPQEAAARIETSEAGRVYKIFVRPAALTKDLTVRISGEVKLAGGAIRPFSVYALVR